MLKELQGSVLPELLGVGSLVLGGAVLVMTYVAGTPLSRLPQISAEVAEAAETALAEVHKRGVAHGDIRLENFVLLAAPATAAAPVGDVASSSEGGSGSAGSSGGVRVVLLDLGCAYVDPPRAGATAAGLPPVTPAERPCPACCHTDLEAERRQLRQLLAAGPGSQPQVDAE